MFTLRECQQVFELMLNTELEQSSFRKRLLDADIIEAIPGAFARGPNRPAALFRQVDGPSVAFFPGMLRGKRAT